MPKTRRIWILLPSFALAVACASSSGGSAGDAGAAGPTLDTTGYDHSCTVNEDCAPVIEGDVCGACACANAQINKKDADRYNAKRADLAKSCAPEPAHGCPACPQRPRVPACIVGICNVVEPPSDGGPTSDAADAAAGGG